MRQLGLAEGLGEGASPALIVFALSMPAYLISVAAQFFLEALNRPKPGMWAMWVANGVNLGLNLLLVPDLLGIGQSGAVASAWATFGARTALAVFLVVYILRLPEARSLGVFARPARDRPAEREQRKIGYGAGSSYFIEVGAFAAMTFIAGRLGAVETTAWTIVLNISAIVFMVPMGLSAATAVLVGQAYGARDRAGVLRAGLVGIGVVTGLAFVIAALVWPTADLLTQAYNRDPLLVAVAAPALALATLFFVADAIQVVAASANRAAGDIWWPTILHFVAYSAIMMPLGWWLAHEIGVNGLVWAVIIASLVSATLLTGRFVRVARRLA
jgi:MATE family multidrug resistance protein